MTAITYTDLQEVGTAASSDSRLRRVSLRYNASKYKPGEYIHIGRYSPREVNWFDAVFTGIEPVKYCW